MYIPLTFFGSQGSCITATTTSITGSGGVSTGSFISGGLYWQYYKFENTANPKAGVTSSFVANLNILSGSTSQAKILVVGGGGGGGFNPGDSCINPYIDTLGSAGGGGGGGVVYYNQFSLSSGSYEISVGAGGVGADAIPFTRIGLNGSVSYFKNKSFEYTPFTSSFITAYGGGGGAGNTYNCTSAGYGIGNSGASSGGGSQTAIAGNLVPAVGTYPYTGGNPPVIQGYGAGSITGNPYGNDRAMGGGGAATSSANITSTYNPAAGSPGGNGLFYNLTGTELGYGAGGGGVRWTNTGTGILTGNGAGWGNAGSGGTGGFGGRFSTPRGSEPGLNGIVIVAWPICASTFSCKTFNITGSTSGVSYLPCTLPYVTQSRVSSPTDYFSACLLTWSGSNIPVILEGETTASVGGECGNQFTQSFDCNCTFVQAIAGSGTQTLTYFPCNGSGSITSSVTTAGKNICVEYGSNVSLTGIGSAINYYGGCTTGSVCTGVQYTSSIQYCSSILATAGGSGGTLTYLPCGASAAVSLTLSGSESMSICAGLTSSFLGLTGGGSTLQTLGACSASILFPYSIIQNCSSSVTASAQFSGSYYPATGFTFISTTTGAENCWSVIGTASLSTFPTYTNVITQSAFTNCVTCLASSPLGVDYLLVAGGGGGGGGNLGNGPGAGGGAGGLLSGSSTLPASNTYSIVIGTGGKGGLQNSNSGSNGLNSSAFGLTAIGGGGGAGNQKSGSNGGSGGGAGARAGTPLSGGLAISGQGNIGGAGGTGNVQPGGGGGGASSAGTTWTSIAGTYTSRAGDGGSGSAWLNGNYYAGGGSGGGSGFDSGYSPGIPGIGGGGTGGDAQFLIPAISPAPNTGAGGGGGASYNSSITTATSGSAGIAIIRYAGTGSKATGGTITYSGSYTYHTFTASGNFITN